MSTYLFITLFAIHFYDGHKDFPQVDASEEEKFSPSQRRGRMYLIELNSDDDGVENSFRLECPAVLDVKWCPLMTN